MSTQIGKKGNNKNTSTIFKDKKKIWILVGVVAIFMIGLVIFSNNGKKIASTKVTEDGDLIIPKNEITQTAKFYPYTADGIYMEVLAIKADDGSIRTAFNTCQVCFDSGRGYYVQEGKGLICQNCGNRFRVDDVEVVRGGCNPIPILKEDKTETDETITISKELMVQYKDLFSTWKR